MSCSLSRAAEAPVPVLVLSGAVLVAIIGVLPTSEISRPRRFALVIHGPQVRLPDSGRADHRHRGELPLPVRPREPLPYQLHVLFLEAALDQSLRTVSA